MKKKYKKKKYGKGWMPFCDEEDYFANLESEGDYWGESPFYDE